MRVDVRPLVDRFWSKVALAGPDECWLWTGPRSSKGYGQFWDGKHWRAHRLAWEIANGEPIAERLVLHRCDNPPCCNPAHLRAGTSADNNADMMAKGRWRHPKGAAKLGPQQVRSIRLSQEPLGVLAAKYGVSKATICRARNYKQWKDVS